MDIDWKIKLNWANCSYINNLESSNSVICGHPNNKNKPCNEKNCPIKSKTIIEVT